MFEGGANVLRLSYSVHRELNVKNSGEKSRDFSLPLGVPSVGYNHPTSHHHAPPGGFDGHGPRFHHGYADEAQVNGTAPVQGTSARPYPALCSVCKQFANLHESRPMLAGQVLHTYTHVQECHM